MIIYQTNLETYQTQGTTRSKKKQIEKENETELQFKSMKEQ